jgi:hypothetical protein
MRMMNKKLNLPQLTHIMREFERQNEKMEMTSDMMGDAVDDAMGVGLLFCACVCALLSRYACLYWVQVMTCLHESLFVH